MDVVYLDVNKDGKCGRRLSSETTSTMEVTLRVQEGKKKTKFPSRSRRWTAWTSRRWTAWTSRRRAAWTTWI